MTGDWVETRSSGMVICPSHQETSGTHRVRFEGQTVPGR